MSWIVESMNGLDLRGKIGQMISSRAISHYVANDSEVLEHYRYLVRDLGVGGITFFQGTVPGQVHFTNLLQAEAKIPLLIAQDAENGIGMRLTDATILPHMMAIGASAATSNAYQASSIIAAEANALGVHHVFAPVADINTNPDNPIVNTRSFGSDAKMVSEFVVEACKGLQDHNVIATAKHFPGHGDTSTDTHLNLATLPFEMDRLNSVELVPFRAAIEAGVRSIMIGHLSVPSLDDSGAPASLSRPIVTGLLREQLNFEGLVVTDALDMNAITNTYGAGEAAVRAVEAGVDMLLLVSDEHEAIESIVTAVESGRITEHRINEAVRRVLIEKEWCRLDSIQPVSMDHVFGNVATLSNIKAARALALDGVCKLGSDSISITRDSHTENAVLVIPIVDDACSKYSDVLVRELESELRIISTDKIYPEIARQKHQDVVEAARKASNVVVPIYLSVRSYSGSISFPPDVLDLIRAIHGVCDPRIVLFGSPYVYNLISTDSNRCIATCSTSQASEWAAAQILLGLSECKGTLPVEL